MRERRPLAFRIGTRILLFNLLIVFLPVLSLLLLGTYEEQLLDALENNLVQQGRVTAAALATAPGFDAATSQDLLRALQGRHQARIRVLDADGGLLADSSVLAPGAPADDRSDGIARSLPAPRDSLLYRFGSLPVRVLRNAAGSPEAPLPSADFYAGAAYADGSEVQAALAGRYGAATRVSAGGQISVTLYSALPVRRDSDIVGAVLVSQSTFRILQDLYRLRIDVFRVFLWSLLAAVVLSVFLALTIARPLTLLQERARNVVDEYGRLTAPLPPTARRDEIGALGRSLSELTRQIEGYTRRLEGFAADASHELKNPLASISANCEMALEARDDARKVGHLLQAQAGVQRALAIISGMRELSQIDSRSQPPGRAIIVEAVEAAVSELRSRCPNHRLELWLDGAPEEIAGTGIREAEVPLPQERIHQILSNLVENARSFTPPDTRIVVTLRGGRVSDALELWVMDEGPGFEEPQRVFDRFYSSRADRDGHLGLGLSIVQAIAESVGGSVAAANRQDAPSGAVVRVVLPVVAG
jgi:two-component system, OmpR family, sensor histidine kinase ChvG